MSELIGEFTTAQLNLPKAKSTLHINEELGFHFHAEMPNWWFRLWQKLFLGFKWEKAE